MKKIRVKTSVNHKIFIFIASSSSNSPCDSPTTSNLDIDMVNMINISTRQQEFIRSTSDDAMPYHQHQESNPPHEHIQTRHKDLLLFRPLENAQSRLESGVSRLPVGGCMRPDHSRYEGVGIRPECSRKRHESLPSTRQESHCITS